MKKTAAYIICVMLVFASAACGCSKKEKFAFPESVGEEYERAYTVNGGKAYDFDSLKTFSVSQTVSIEVPSLADMKDLSGKRAYPTSESREYLYDARDSGNIRSQVTDKRLKYAGTGKDSIPYYEYTRKLYSSNTLCYPLMNESGAQLTMPVVPAASFSSFNAYLSDPRSYDAQMRNITKYPADMFESMSGGVSTDGKSYNITATVAENNYARFFELFMREYSFIKWYTVMNDSDIRIYEHFLDIQLGFESVKVDIVTSESGVSAVSVRISAFPAPNPIALGEEITLTATSVYSDKAFSSDAIKAPALK